MSTPVCLGTLLALFSFTPPVLADDVFEGTDDAGQKFDEPETELSAEIGAAFATGNTVYYTVNGAVSGAHRFRRNKLTLDLVANSGRAISDADGDGVLSEEERVAGWQRSAEKYVGEARYDRYIGNSASLYLLGGALVDPFAGYDLRTHEQLGYSRILLDTDTSTLVTELGFDVAQEDYVDSVEPGRADIFSARILVGFQHEFNENVSFSEQAEFYENVLDPQDFRLLNDFSITSRLTDTFSMKLSHSLTWDHLPPSDAYRQVDQTLLATLVATLL